VLECVRVESPKHGRGQRWKITSTHEKHAPLRDPSRFCKTPKSRQIKGNSYSRGTVHNHPSGDPKPSRDDIEMTRQLKAAANALELELHDHIVIGHGTHTSFRSLGLL
jgi:hypothetical protein